MEKDIASIYKITNTINGQCYVGFDISYPKRLKQHYNDSKRGKESPLCDDIREYGWENFKKELLYQSWDDEHCLKTMENYFIVESNSFIDGYNRTLGGNGSLNSPRPKSEEWKKKHSKWMLENNPRNGHKFSKEEKINHSNKMKNFYLNNPEKILYGEKNPMFGKKHSEEWRKNHSEKMKKNTNSVKSMTVKRPCSKCGFVTTLGNLARYHDEKCKE
jgi:group I intron endonuclease